MNLKTVVIILALLLLLAIIWLVIQGYKSRQGSAPGLEHGKLSECPNKPNCVCSDANISDETRIKPIQFSEQNQAKTWAASKESILEMGGQVQMEKEGYLSATFSSSVFGFVDDFEVRLDAENNQLHLRSASRVGHSDFGVNRERVELFKMTLNKLLNRRVEN